MNVIEVVVGLVVGLAAGAVSGALGVGGGVVMVPAMALLMGVDQATAQGTSLLVILPTAVAGVVSHQRRRNIDWWPTLGTGLAGTATAVAGAYVALQVDSLRLRQIFAIFLVVVGLRYILRPSRKD